MNNTDLLKNNAAIESMITQLQQGQKPTPEAMLQTVMNLLMQSERTAFLDQSTHNKANGFYERELGTPMGTLQLNIPRDRQGDFRPHLLPQPYQRDIEQRYDLLQSLLVNSYSPNAIARTLNELNMHYNPKELEAIKKAFVDEFDKWQARELPNDVAALFIDAYHTDAFVDGKVRKAVIYVMIGIDFTGQKDLYGIYLCVGRENKSYWLQTLNQLIDRGLKCPLMVISDDFSGLKDAISTLFPYALHQLCYIHMQRNVRRHMGKDDAERFNKQLSQMRFEEQADRCEKAFKTLCEDYQKKYPTFVKALLNNTPRYFAFTHLPLDIRKYFYTTNIVESANSILERTRIRMGGFFQSEEALKVNIYITFKALREKKWAKGIHKLKPYLYDLRQLFATRYDRAVESSEQ